MVTAVGVMVEKAAMVVEVMVEEAVMAVKVMVEEAAMAIAAGGGGGGGGGEGGEGGGDGGNCSPTAFSHKFRSSITSRLMPVMLFQFQIICSASIPIPSYRRALWQFLESGPIKGVILVYGKVVLIGYDVPLGYCKEWPRLKKSGLSLGAPVDKRPGISIVWNESIHAPRLYGNSVSEI